MSREFYQAFSEFLSEEYELNKTPQQRENDNLKRAIMKAMTNRIGALRIALAQYTDNGNMQNTQREA